MLADRRWPRPSWPGRLSSRCGPGKLGEDPAPGDTATGYVLPHSFPVSVNRTLCLPAGRLASLMLLSRAAGPGGAKCLVDTTDNGRRTGDEYQIEYQEVHGRPDLCGLGDSWPPGSGLGSGGDSTERAGRSRQG